MALTAAQALISGYSKANRPTLVKEVIATMKQEGLKLDMVAYSAIIGGIARCGLFAEARGECSSSPSNLQLTCASSDVG